MAGEISQGMVSVLRARLNDLAGTRWTDAELYAALNAGFLELAHQLPDAALGAITFAAQTALVTGTNDYALPADFMRERQVLYKTIPATRWRIGETRALISDTLVHAYASETNPFYRIWNGNVMFYVNGVTQSASDYYEIRYIKEPTTISSTADPDLSAAYFDAVEDYAVADCLAEAGRSDIAKVHRAHFREFCLLVNAQYSNPNFVYDGLPMDMAVEDR